MRLNRSWFPPVLVECAFVVEIIAGGAFRQSAKDLVDMYPRNHADGLSKGIRAIWPPLRVG